MSTATMHFGPEWMRTKNQSVPRSLQPSPPPATALPQAPSTVATYSALVSVTPVANEKLDESHPFRYSKEELLDIYQEGGGKGGLGLEVDRWDGVVRELAAEPVTLREMTDAEKKLFAGSLNSEIRRRPSQSTDHFSPLNASISERPRMMPGGSVTGSRERFSGMKRKDSAGCTADSSYMPRKPALSTLPVPGVLSPTSPRTRVGYTHNFDGVLNSGESWVSRRRYSEASLKVSGTEFQVEDSASKPVGIAEVREEDSATAVRVRKEEGTFLSPTSASAIPTTHSELSATKETVENISGTASLPTTYRDYQEIGQSPVIVDLAAVEWSYKDPTGQVQGPFRADLMQKWYEEGYFTPDLPMKRTHLDSQWFTVQELITQATGAGVFLAPPPPAGPPGLARQPSHRNSEHTHKEPFQPAPIRSLRSSTLDSSLASDSPSSSLGAPQLGNLSPDPSAFIGRDKRHYEADGRIPGFGLQDLSAPGFIGTRLNSSNGFVPDLGTPFERLSSGNFVPDLDPGLNGHVFNNLSPIIQDSWTAFPNSSFGIPNANLTTSHGVPPANLFNDGVARGYGFDLGGSNYFGGPQPGTIASNPVNYTPTHELAGNVPFTGLVSQPYAAQIPDFGHHQQPSGLRMQEAIVPAIHNGLPAGQSPWGIIPNPRIHTSMPVERLESTTHHESGGLNGGAITGSLSDEANANRVDVGFDGQHNAPQGLAQLLDEKLAVEQDSRTASSDNIFEASETGKILPKASKPVLKPPLDPNALSDSPVAQTPAKSAWTKDDDVKGKRATTSTSISLRAIQEAEARKQRSLKGTEREKEKTRPGVISEVKEDSQPFTTSWGLPTSQAGARSNTHPPTKDMPAPSAPTIQASPVSPVWTASAKTPVVKKSMKEIQEEEEKRKKQAARDNSVTVTPKRAYADTTLKTTPSPVAPNTNPWATVGSNGKTTFLTQPSRSPANATSFSSAVSGPSVSRSTAPLNQRISTTSSIKTRPVTTRPGEVPEAPSLEFLKWLGEALKGVNSSANVEEIMSMLFSFPLDPDSSTLEIISDTIYANSTTLDGRRFAAEFVAKRKADAAARSKGPADSGKAPANKPVSIADVVKAVPKSTQAEWGFKVVNKKKKGGRS